MYIKAHLIQHIMAKSLRQKRRNGKNKTQSRRSSRKMNGGREFDKQNLHELKELLGNNRHLFAVHSDEETCGHCRKFKPEWEKVLARLTPHPELTVAKLGPHATDYMNEHHYRKHNHTVNGVPTIIYYIVNVNKKPQEYDGEHTADKIIAWLTKVLDDNNLEINIKSKSHDDDASFEAPASDLAPVSEPASATAEPEPVRTELAQTELGPAATEPAQQPAQQVQDAFPQAPLTPASTLSNATETIKTTAANVDSKIEQGVNAVKSVLSSEFDVGEKIGNLFSSAPAPATDNNGVAAANPTATTSESPDLVPNPVNVPAVPSLVGGVKHRRTMRMHKKSKKSRKSRKSKKSKKSKN